MMGQEIALTKNAVIFYGPDEISWWVLSVAVELFVKVEIATHRLLEIIKDPLNLSRHSVRVCLFRPQV
ncbi:uncharacterized protein BCR38DRAFT_445128 [Pseudomassariella vexata]|uniref:Uncharacterized protein n=1 Tax=Pseudomassariella vexata TaxID=1141098 RepID=A0A1Y2DK40_9PEZI|nr:uncharacterized protein BCR38DRAFT_445128 [Pseudomassariella vexata]ORY59648.1 hypothetical protein BCR38DRAFT_445128 [Pseudomassariella vexata]